ncbi:MAG: zincin-like metallopeptidase domain-containing protein, partial [Gammaproteobacteria bacterium]|nr:zincin-like metallopeptidase domain-containing protein [Gammaproteobacteria bacterium]
REDHAAYIGSWLKVLKDDKKAIFSAAAHAQRAVELLHHLQPAPALEATAENEQTMDSHQPGPAQG